MSKLFKWLENHPDEKFFAFLHSSYTHDPYYYKKGGDGYDVRYSFFTEGSNYKGSIIDTYDETFKKFKEKDVIKAKNLDKSSNYNEFIKFWWSFVNFQDPEDIKRLKDLYDNNILHVDYYIGRLISYLKEKKLYKKHYHHFGFRSWGGFWRAWEVPTSYSSQGDTSCPFDYTYTWFQTKENLFYGIVDRCVSHNSPVDRERTSSSDGWKKLIASY